MKTNQRKNGTRYSNIPGIHRHDENPAERYLRELDERKNFFKKIKRNKNK